MSDIRRKIRDHMEEVDHFCQVTLGNGRRRMLWRSGLDQPESKLPKLLRALQAGANVVRLSEFKGDNLLSERKFTFRELGKAIDEFLSGVDDEKKIMFV